MKLYILQDKTMIHPKTYYALATDPQHAVAQVEQAFREAGYDHVPLITDTRLLAETGITGKPEILVTPYEQLLEKKDQLYAHLQTTVDSLNRQIQKT